jgi:DNA-directed RNA polymerase subunit RPC12/RpoP
MYDTATLRLLFTIVQAAGQAMKFVCAHCQQSVPVQGTKLSDGLALTCASCGKQTIVLLEKEGRKRKSSRLQRLAKSDAPQLPINRWMKSRMLRYPHFILYQQDGLFRSACGQVVRPDMEDLTPTELTTVRNDHFGMNVCRSCHDSHLRHERDPFSPRNQRRQMEQPG